MAIRRGTRNDDNLFGTRRSDLLVGNRGDDRLTGGLGNDLFQGGAGFDTAVLSGSVVDSTVVRVGSVVRVSGPDGIDALIGVEALEFADFTLRIDGANNDPFARGDAAAADEDTPIALPLARLLANDLEFDGDALGFAGLDLSATRGLVSESDGIITYSANGRFDALDAGESATDTFAYAVEDGRGGRASAVVTVTVHGVNDAPFARPDAIVTDEDTAVLGSVLADNGSGADEDVEGQSLSVEAVNGAAADVGTQITLPSGALLTLAADGTFTYDPNGRFETLGEGESASDSFTYTVGDGHGGSASATVEITIEGREDSTPSALDLFVGKSNGTNQVQINDGRGGFTASDVAGATFTFGVALGDLDGDGDLDAIAANFGQASQVLINDGQGALTAHTIAGADRNSRGVALGDLDGDGDLDAILVNNFPAPKQLLLNDGNGTFTVTDLAGPARFSWDVALGDVDGDGDLDALVATASGGAGQANQLLVNDGSGSFTAVDLPGADRASQAIALGDLDGDGDLDALVANASPQTNQILSNDGSGTFTIADVAGGGRLSMDVALGDLDGDGDLDAVVANAGAQTNQRLLNDGTGRFTTSDLPGGARESWDVALGDLDGDGDLDVVVANAGQADQVLLNDGSGTFTAVDLQGGALNSYAVAIGDLDGDGGGVLPPDPAQAIGVGLASLVVEPDVGAAVV